MLHKSKHYAELPNDADNHFNFICQSAWSLVFMLSHLIFFIHLVGDLSETVANTAEESEDTGTR